MQSPSAMSSRPSRADGCFRARRPPCDETPRLKRRCVSLSGLMRGLTDEFPGALPWGPVPSVPFRSRKGRHSQAYLLLPRRANLGLCDATFWVWGVDAAPDSLWLARCKFNRSKRRQQRAAGRWASQFDCLAVSQPVALRWSLPPGLRLSANPPIPSFPSFASVSNPKAGQPRAAQNGTPGNAKWYSSWTVPAR